MKSRSFRVALATVVACASTCGARAARAEEGGSGHYLPGAMASFADGVAPKPSFLVRYNLIHNSGSVAADRPLPVAGVTTLGLDATIWGHGLPLFWRPPIDLGERWSYAMSATVPLLMVDVRRARPW